MTASALSSCGEESPLLASDTAVVAGDDSSSDSERSAESAGSERPAEPDVAQAPGMPTSAYPPPPYGTEQGAVIENLEFFGWRNPAASGFDVASGETIRLSDFYDPSGSGQGSEYLLINAVATWCGVCRTEYQDLKNKGTYAELAARGVQMLGVLFEDNNGAPSKYQDMSNWARTYAVEFPFVNDPAFRTGVYFDKSATPMNMLVDARTMEIVLVMTGYNPLIYTQVDKLLKERGR